MDEVYKLPPFTVESVITTLAQSIPWGIANNNVPDTWKETQGEGIRVAVLDTGTTSHPDLEGAVVASRDFTGGGDATDRQGHSTHCCGIVAARNNDLGVVGVAPAASLVVGKVLGDDGSGRGNWIAAGIAWAMTQGADIISMSLGSSSPDSQILGAIERAFVAGKIIVCAAGNSGPGDNTTDWPGKSKYVTAVAAYRKDGTVSDFSSRGPEVDVAAPGEAIVSTYLNGQYAKLSGTSMATPFVAGVAALCVAKHRKVEGKTPLLNNDDFIAHIKATSKDAGPPGHDPAYGWGLVNPKKLLEEEPATSPPAPTPPANPPTAGVWVFIPGGVVKT
jgi:subtilisin family serine protease